MRLFIWNDSSQQLGGGFSFIRNFTSGIQNFDIELVLEPVSADVIFIPAPTMVDKTDEVKQFTNKKIVLRVDNAVRNSRNRGTGMGKMKRLADMATVVVYQSEWSKNYLAGFLGNPRHAVIYNGINTEIFNKNGSRGSFGAYKPVYLYSRYNRDEIKNWEVAWYKFQDIHKQNNNAKLVLVGRFSDEVIQYNFDFFNGEHFEYLGVIEDPYRMAEIYRGCDYFLATYFNDCYSNTYQEAMACGCQLFEPNMSGGTPELIENGVIDLNGMIEKYYNLFNVNL